MARFGVLGAVACCGVILSAAGTPASSHDADSASPNPLAVAAAAPTPSTYSEGLRDIPHSLRRSAHPSRSASRTKSASRSPVSRTSSHSAPPPSTTPPPISPPAGRPGPNNTGVPAGTALRSYVGNMVITKSGTTIDRMDIHGFVTVAARDVTIKRSIIRGGVAKNGQSIGVVSAVDPAVNHFVLSDSEIAPAYPSVAIDGIQGSEYTLVRVNIHGAVDDAKVFGNNVAIEQSWLHGTVSYAHDPYQGGGPSHNDAIQVGGGRNILITGNTIQGGTNSALQVTQGLGPVSNLTFTKNWVDGGGCSANIDDEPRSSMSGINISGNSFGHTSTFKNCAIIVSNGVALQHVGNLWANTDQPVALTPRS